MDKTKRLSRDTSYKAPEKTYQSTLTKEDIKKNLIDYVKVDSKDVSKIPLSTHIRYFTTNPKTNKTEFRLGGNLTKHGDNNQYIVLSNGTFSWSVQLGNSTIYKKLNIDEIKDKVEEECQDDMQKLAEENKKLKKMLKEIKERTENIKKKK